MQKLIDFNEETKTFHLHNDLISYLFQIEEGGLLSHLYFGKAVRQYHDEMKYPHVDRGFSGNLPGSLDRTFSPDTLRQEYSTNGIDDYRTPAIIVHQANGSYSSRFQFESFRIENGKPKLKGLPSTYTDSDDEAQTLIVTLTDHVSNIKLDLLYTIYAKRAVITRSVQVQNQSENPVYLEKIASMQLDFPARDFDVISLPGAHAAERQMERERLNRGIRSFESKRGSTSHQMNNFIALVDPTTTENQGDAFGFTLVYSGNYQLQIERDQIEQTRVITGINDYNFSWKLEQHESFQSPEAVMVYSPKGLNQMSQTFHHLIAERLVPKRFRHKERPILVNNWEATFMDFDEDKLRPIVDDAKKLGIEMFVLDDGWFGHRDDDNTSLGDWKVDQRKFPHGLKHFVDYVHSKGLQFGLWFEPEMISYDSDLYREHPDYLMQVPGRKPAPSRNEYLLDLTRKDVRQNIVAQIKKVLRENDVDYVKWDMNRHLSDVYSSELPADQQGEVFHRYVLGVYEMFAELTADFPNILFEGCSGGGGRFDMGITYYMPQTWTSDNTDAVARQEIQYATSLVYPPSVMTAHISVVPNQQTNRTVSLEMRANCAMSAVFGYELDLTQMTATEQAEVQKQVEWYKQNRKLIQFGDFYRLKNPFNTNECAWMVVSPNKDEFIVTTFKTFGNAQPISTITKLIAINADAMYQNVDTKEIFGGDELMNIGFFDPLYHSDYTSKRYHFKLIN